MDKVSSSAEEDNWDYNKIQRINNNKKNGEYLHATLLVNNAPIKFILDSGSPVTLIPQRLFNKYTEVEELKTNYKDVNDNKNYKNKHYTVNGIRLDETAWNNIKHNNRRY